MVETIEKLQASTKPLTAMESRMLDLYAWHLDWFRFHGQDPRRWLCHRETMIGPEPFQTHWQNLLDDIKAGRQNSFFIEKGGDNIFGRLPISAEGVKNIPPEGGAVAVFNHTDQGPAQGLWVPWVARKIFSEYITAGDQIRYPFIMANNKHYFDGLERHWLVQISLHPLPWPVRDFVHQKIRDGRAKFKKHAGRIMQNVAVATGMIYEGSMGAWDIIDYIKHGNVIGIFPGERSEYRLNDAQRVGRAASTILRRAGQNGIKVLPVGVWASHAYHLNIGEPEIFSPEKYSSAAQIAVHTREMLAELLPREMR